MNWNKKQTEKIQGKIREMFLEGKMTQQEIADQLHVSRAHVNRTIQQIKEKIELKKKASMPPQRPAVQQKASMPPQRPDNMQALISRIRQEQNDLIQRVQAIISEKSPLEKFRDLIEVVEDNIKAMDQLSPMELTYVIRSVTENADPVEHLHILAEMLMIKPENHGVAVSLGMHLKKHPEQIQEAKDYLDYKQELEYRAYKEKITGKKSPAISFEEYRQKKK